jgi:2-polyprenyl-3-methyl-5-hydroxy-6-metoxy-1,4-benzoquinol methylase
MLSRDHLSQLFEVERHYTKLILDSPKGSDARAQLIKEGYDAVVNLRRSLEGGNGVDQVEVSNFTPNIFHVVFEGLKPKRVLEIGCGTGALSVALAEAGCTVVGQDPSEAQLEAARKTGAARGVDDHCTFIRGSLADLGSERDFDVIVNQDLIEHIHPDEVDEFMTECMNRLRPGGFLITDTPSRITGPHDVSRTFVPRGTPAQGFHLREYSVADLAALYRRHGFVDLASPVSHPKMCRALKWYRWSQLNLKRAVVIEKAVALLPPKLRSDMVVKLIAYPIIAGRKPG